MTLKRIRVCVIEDEGIVRAGIKLLLAGESDIKVVGEAADRETAFKIVEEEQPDILLVDILLGSDSAVDFLPELLQCCNAAAILLTSSSTREQVRQAIDAGAVGLVYKDEPPDVLIRAIRKVHAGEAWLSRSAVSAALARLRDGRSQSGKEETEAAASKIATLTVREREVIALIANGQDRKRIAAKLCVSEGTVRNHLTSIFAKLGVSNQFELAFYARRHGLNKVSDPGG